MLRYIARRLVLTVPLLIGISLISFLVIHAAPGGPVEMATDLNPKVTAEARERLRAYYGLDQPIHVQYVRWLGRMATLDFGQSFSRDGKQVSEKIGERIPVTLAINVLSMLLIFLVAIPIGVYSAVRKDSWFDRISTVVVFTGFAVPTFWLALLLMILFGVKLGGSPSRGSSRWSTIPWAWRERSGTGRATSSFRCSCRPSGDWPGSPATCGRTCWR